MSLTKKSLILMLSFFIAGFAAAEQAAEAGETAAQPAAEQAAANEPVAAKEESPAEPSAEPVAAQPGEVSRAAFTTAIQDREPTDEISSATTDSNTVYYFTELKNLQNQAITHRWEYNGEVMAEVKFNVGGPRWRVWSSKQLQDDWTGAWKVSVINAAGEVINTQNLEYQKAAAEEKQVAEESPAVANEVANTTPSEQLDSEPVVTE